MTIKLAQEKKKEYSISVKIRFSRDYVLFFLGRQPEKNQKKKLVAKNYPGAALLADGGLV